MARPHPPVTTMPYPNAVYFCLNLSGAIVPCTCNLPVVKLMSHCGYPRQLADTAGDGLGAVGAIHPFDLKGVCGLGHAGFLNDMIVEAPTESGSLFFFQVSEWRVPLTFIHLGAPRSWGHPTKI